VKLIEHGPTTEIFTTPKDERTERYVHRKVRLDARSSTQFREALRELEQQDARGHGPRHLAAKPGAGGAHLSGRRAGGMVVADDDRIDGRYLEVHQGVLSLLARQAPVAGDLRIVAALLHIIRCVERMGDQCVNVAKLVAAIRL